jgi:hypothetical protein
MASDPISKLRRFQPGDRRPLPGWLKELKDLPYKASGYTAEEVGAIVKKAMSTVYEILNEFLEPVRFQGPYRTLIYSTESLHRLGQLYADGYRYRANAA